MPRSSPEASTSISRKSSTRSRRSQPSARRSSSSPQAPERSACPTSHPTLTPPSPTPSSSSGSFGPRVSSALGAAIIQLNFETPEIDPFGRLSTAVRGGRARIVQRLNLELWNAAEKQNIAVLDLNEAAASYGKQRWNNPGMWIAARQYPAADAVPFLAREHRRSRPGRLRTHLQMPRSRSRWHPLGRHHWGRRPYRNSPWRRP